jgi:hypothetical protein
MLLNDNKINKYYLTHIPSIVEGTSHELQELPAFFNIMHNQKTLNLENKVALLPSNSNNKVIDVFHMLNLTNIDVDLTSIVVDYMKEVIQKNFLFSIRDEMNIHQVPHVEYHSDLKILTLRSRFYLSPNTTAVFNKEKIYWNNIFDATEKMIRDNSDSFSNRIADVITSYCHPQYDIKDHYTILPYDEYINDSVMKLNTTNTSIALKEIQQLYNEKQELIIIAPEDSYDVIIDDIKSLYHLPIEQNHGLYYDDPLIWN